MYSTSEQQLIDGVRGAGLYTIVQHSPHGTVCLFLVLRIRFPKVDALKLYFEMGNLACLQLISLGFMRWRIVLERSNQQCLSLCPDERPA